jgi:diadenosine tetraphosphate (Ap4A) HIT family hydrolase
MAEIPRRLIIFERTHWTLNHRVDCALPGYLMLAARTPGSNLADLPDAALADLGPLLAQAQRALTAILQPDHFYIGRFGHTAGYPLHFHLVPVPGWVKQRFRADARYDAVRALGPRSDPEQTDGAEMLLYIWREFCESGNPPDIAGPSIDEVMQRLRSSLASPPAA